MTLLKFLLISDIHACDVDPASPTAPSYVSSFSASASAKLDPLTELKNLIAADGLQPDLILCAGDIANRSHPNSLSYAWHRLNELAGSCKARLISTVGNHDLDSRYQANKYDPRGYLMSLTPEIPDCNRLSYLEFWAENYTLIETDLCNLLVLNTAAYHGAGKDVAEELEHGRISEITLASIKRRLESVSTKAVNIALCHHHPIRGDPIDQDLAGQTRGGEGLVELLGNMDEPWIIIHGHKHEPDLFYGYGGANSPVIMSCASFGAQFNVIAQNTRPNQFHLLVSDPDGAMSAGLASAGHVRSWTWQPGVGWIKSLASHGLDHIVGFGYRGSVSTLAKELDDYLEGTGLSHISWGQALQNIPSLGRLVPNDFAALIRVLEKKNLRLLRQDDGTIAQVGRSP